jgi:hypothetical protein
MRNYEAILKNISDMVLVMERSHMLSRSLDEELKEHS